MSVRRTVTLTVLLAALAARAAPAQSSDYWVFYLFPLPSYNAVDGLSVSLIGGWRKPPPPGPQATGMAIEPAAWVSTSGARGGSFIVDAPGYVRGWRFLGLVSAERIARAPYFGLGNDSRNDDSLKRAAGGRHYYRYQLHRTRALVQVQRRLVGPVRVLAGASWRHYAARPLLSRLLSRLRDELEDSLAAGGLSAVAPEDTGSATLTEWRAGLILDTRNEEASPSRGVMVEALVHAGTGRGGTERYTRIALSAREFIPVAELWTVGVRTAVELAHGQVPFYVQSEILTSERPRDGFGGPLTIRANLPGRWIGPDKALLNLDVRYRRWDFDLGGNPIRLWFIGFADAGRVWDDSRGERFSTRGLHTGYGVGTRLQLSRGALFGFDFGWSPDTGIDFTTAVTFAY